LIGFGAINLTAGTIKSSQCGGLNGVYFEWVADARRIEGGVSCLGCPDGVCFGWWWNYCVGDVFFSLVEYGS